ncbi:MAG: T9SS type A sorting domain-containing protein [Bacteroidia bacterium]|nr:T9SS type A sorting domain-containing protein [Bacteroidia bacterium]
MPKRAHFKSPASVQIFNNFEEFADDGTVRFRDPWFVDGNGDQTGEPNDFPSPYIPTGNANYPDPSDAAVFLDQPVTSGRPFYSAEFPTFLSWDRGSTVTPPLAQGDWSLVRVYARDADDAVVSFSSEPNVYELSQTRQWQRTASLGVDLKFENPDAQIFAFYKAHMRATQEIPPTRGNSQRKIAAMRWTWDSTWYHAVYVSGGRVWYTWTEDAGDTWQPEVLISDFHHNASNPCIAVKNEHDPGSLAAPTMIYISYVDNSAGAVVLKSKLLSERPDAWYTLDSIAVADPPNTHPVVAAASYSESRYCVLVYEGNKQMRYSVYNASFPLYAGHQTSQGTANVLFSDVLLEDGLWDFRPDQHQPEYPSISHLYACNNAKQFVVAWREGITGRMRYKMLTIDDQTPGSTVVVNPDAANVPANSINIANTAGPSVTSQCFGGNTVAAIAYEMVNRGTFPNPAQISPLGLSMMGRTFMPVTSLWPIVTPDPTLPIPTGNRVAVTRFSAAGTRVTQVTNLPSTQAVKPEPVLNFSMFNGSMDFLVAMNLREVVLPLTSVAHEIAYARFPHNMPATVAANAQAMGYYPAISELYKPLEIFSTSWGYPSPADPGSPVLREALQYHVNTTTTGLRKSTSILVSDPLRELVVRKNDSSYAMFGIVKPHVIAAGENYTEIEWDLEGDSLDLRWWSDIGRCMRTAPFTVPTGGAVEYGNELYAEYPADLDSSMVVLVRFRDASSHQVLLENSIDMYGYQGDTALYVLDRHDLSNIGGSTVYMCIELADTTSADGWEVQVITSLDTLQQQKAMAHDAPRPTGLTLEQNAPNPFNPTTSISYGIESDAHVELLVHDHLGRKVATLVQQHTAAGRHRVTFDARNLPSGVYYYRLSALGQSLTRKMTLLR